MQNSRKRNSKNAESTDIEFRIVAAMRPLLPGLRDNADCFTFESAQRLLEEDMGLNKHALDVHKSFVKKHLLQCLEDTANDGASENSQETERKDDGSPTKTQCDEHEEAENISKTVGNKETLMRDIRKALRKRASYIKANSENVTMGSLRRLLEEDLKLEKHFLDYNSFKKFIDKELNEVLQIPHSPKRAAELQQKVKSTPSKQLYSEENSDSNAEDDEKVAVKKTTTPKRGADLKKKVKSTPSKKPDSEENFDSDAEEVAVKETTTPKRKRETTKLVSPLKKAKHAATDSDNDSEENSEDDEEVAVKKTFSPMRKQETAKLVSPLKKAKHAVIDLDNDSDAEDNESMGDNSHSQSSSEKPLKQTKEIATAVYGKSVNHLKSVIKSCGMSIPPAIYRKAKQVPEDKREATLIKELKQILAKEGLSSDPSEKEIKEVKKRKNLTKELEGIDASNIVSSSRRRSTTSFAPPPKPKITEASESDA